MEPSLNDLLIVPVDHQSKALRLINSIDLDISEGKNIPVLIDSRLKVSPRVTEDTILQLV